jgi:hypothetical protein
LRDFTSPGIRNASQSVKTTSRENTMVDWRQAGALAACGLVAACATPSIAQRGAETPALTLEQYFAGQTYAYGLFEDGSDNARRKFYVIIDGTWNGSELVLNERFLYDDGERQTRIWTFRKQGAGYVASANDVVGEVAVTQIGDAAQFSYLVDLKIGEDQSLRVRFNDRLYLFAGDLMMNRARVSKFGVEVGEVTVVFLRDRPEGFPEF